MHAGGSTHGGRSHLRKPHPVWEHDGAIKGAHRQHSPTLVDRWNGRKTGGSVHIDSIYAWRTGNNAADDDGSLTASGDADRRSSVLDTWHDPHGGPRRYTLRG